LLLIVMLLTNSLLVHAQGVGVRSVAIVPICHGENCRSVVSMSDEVRDRLTDISDLQIVSKENTETVIGYHEPQLLPEKILMIDRWIAAANNSYYQLNYIEAKSLLKKVIAELQGNKELLFHWGDRLIRAYITEGIVARSMGNVGEARQSFLAAIRMDPEYRLDRRAFSPSLIQEFERARESVQRMASGTLRVVSNPKVAEVKLNGRLLGVTPVTVDRLPVGTHYLKISANRYQDILKRIEIRGGERLKVKEKLSWLGEATGRTSDESHGDPFRDVDEALQIADLLRVDGIVRVALSEGSDETSFFRAQLVDSEFRIGYPIVQIPYKRGDDLSDLAGRLVTSLKKGMGDRLSRSLPQNIEPAGLGDPRVAVLRRHRGISKKVVWGVVGGVLAAGLAGGLAAAFAGGSKAPTASTGSVNLQFE